MNAIPVQKHQFPRKQKDKTVDMKKMKKTVLKKVIAQNHLKTWSWKKLKLIPKLEAKGKRSLTKTAIQKGIVKDLGAHREDC